EERDLRTLALTDATGFPLRYFDRDSDHAVAWHKSHGFVTDATAARRRLIRERSGALHIPEDKAICRFAFRNGVPVAIANCQLAHADEGVGPLVTPIGEYALVEAARVAPTTIGEDEHKDDRRPVWALVAVLFLLVGIGVRGFLLQEAAEKAKDLNAD